MKGLMDSSEETNVEVAVVISGTFRTDKMAYEQLPKVQVAIADLLEKDWPNLRVELSQATIGVDDRADEKS